MKSWLGMHGGWTTGYGKHKMYSITAFYNDTWYFTYEVYPTTEGIGSCRCSAVLQGAAAEE